MGPGLRRGGVSIQYSVGICLLRDRPRVGDARVERLRRVRPVSLMRVRTLRFGRCLSLRRAATQSQQRANRCASDRHAAEDRRSPPFPTSLLPRLGDRDRRGRIACRNRPWRAALGRARLWRRLGHWFRRRGGDRLVRNRHGLGRDRLGRRRGSRCRLRCARLARRATAGGGFLCFRIGRVGVGHFYLPSAMIPEA
jgi:hypothetical protein